MYVDEGTTRVRYHRNGVAGEGFYSVTFDHEGLPMVATVFNERGQVAVLSLHDPHATWRGDLFEIELRAAICIADGTREAYQDDFDLAGGE